MIAWADGSQCNIATPVPQLTGVAYCAQPPTTNPHTLVLPSFDVFGRAVTSGPKLKIEVPK